MAKGLLLAAINFSNVADDEFHDWYDTEHIPERERVTGFLNAQRWIGVEDANVSVAIYDLVTVDVLASPGYTAIGGQNLSPWSKRITAKSERLLRFEGVQTLPGDELAPAGAGALLLNAMNGPLRPKTTSTSGTMKSTPRRLPLCRERCASGVSEPRRAP